MKVRIVILSLFMGMSSGLLSEEPMKNGTKEVLDLIASGKTSDDAVPFSPINIQIKVNGVGDMGRWKSKDREITINALFITDNKTVLSSMFHDVIAITSLIHVPALPDLNNLLKINSEGEMIKVLGIPYGGVRKGDFLEWGFFCIDQNELRILIVSALVDRSNESNKLLAIELQTGASK